MSNNKWRRNPLVVARRIGDETILVPTGKSIVDLQCLFTLNDTAGLIWEKLAEPCTFENLCAALVEEFEVTPKQAQADLRRFLAALSDEGCIMEAQDGQADD